MTNQNKKIELGTIPGTFESVRQSVSDSETGVELWTVVEAGDKCCWIRLKFIYKIQDCFLSTIILFQSFRFCVWVIQWLVDWQNYTYHPDSFGLSAETSGRISVRSEAYWTGILTLLSAYSSVSLWRLLTRFNSARGTLYLRERDWRVSPGWTSASTHWSGLAVEVLQV